MYATGSARTGVMWLNLHICSISVLTVVELLNAPAGDPDEECMGIFQTGGDKGVHQLFWIHQEQERVPPPQHFSPGMKSVVVSLHWVVLL